MEVLAGRLTDQLIHCVTQELPSWVDDWLIDWLTDWLIDLLTHSELRSGVLRKIVQQWGKAAGVNLLLLLLLLLLGVLILLLLFPGNKAAGAWRRPLNSFSCRR
jgi:hypothetical protein